MSIADDMRLHLSYLSRAIEITDRQEGVLDNAMNDYRATMGSLLAMTVQIEELEFKADSAARRARAASGKNTNPGGPSVATENDDEADDESDDGEDGESEDDDNDSDKASDNGPPASNARPAGAPAPSKAWQDRRFEKEFIESLRLFAGEEDGDIGQSTLYALADELELLSHYIEGLPGEITQDGGQQIAKHIWRLRCRALGAAKVDWRVKVEETILARAASGVEAAAE